MKRHTETSPRSGRVIIAVACVVMIVIAAWFWGLWINAGSHTENAGNILVFVPLVTAVLATAVALYRAQAVPEAKRVPVALSIAQTVLWCCVGIGIVSIIITVVFIIDEIRVRGWSDYSWLFVVIALGLGAVLIGAFSIFVAIFAASAQRRVDLSFKASLHRCVISALWLIAIVVIGSMFVGFLTGL